MNRSFTWGNKLPQFVGSILLRAAQWQLPVGELNTSTLRAAQWQLPVGELNNSTLRAAQWQLPVGELNTSTLINN